MSIGHRHEHPETESATDPVCGMTVAVAQAFAHREHEGREFHLCSAACAAAFDADPHRYAAAAGAGR